MAVNLSSTLACLLIICLLWTSSVSASLRHDQVITDSTIKVTNLSTEYKTNPLGIDVRKPRLSWQMQAATRGVRQSAYQVRVAPSVADLQTGSNLLWDSGRVNQEDVSKPGPVPMLRREFKLTGAIKNARAYVTSHGLYEMYLNGRRVGEQLFTPGWTSYNKRLQYQTYDVTELLQRGDNAVGVLLGNGWYRGEIGFTNKRNVYGNKVALLCQIKITYKDGREETIGTDQNWKATTGPILMSEIYHGETYDARLEKAGWSEPGFADAQWSGGSRFKAQPEQP